MRKLFAVLVIFAIIFAACEEPNVDDEKDKEEKLPSLTIRNQSSYILTNVKFSGITFSASDNDLPVSSQSTKKLTKNDLNKAGYITFTRKDIGINLRTEAISITNEDYTFTFLDTTVVEEVGNNANKRSISQISFQSTVTVIHNGLNVVKGEILPLGETVVNIPVQFDFSLKNTGVGKLLFTGTQPVKITGEGSEVFSVVQPSSSEIVPDASLTFKINFNPGQIQNYSALVTISSNDQSGDFTFTITARGTASKPIAKVFFENNEISQNGTINIGEALITLSKNFTVEIRNTGTEVLNLDTANITITGDHAAAFTRTTAPGSSISIGGSTSFNIQFSPTVQGENNAVLTIPTNDNSRNPVVVLLKATGVQGHAVLELSQTSTGRGVIENNSPDPVEFGRVELGGSYSNLSFTIKNSGNIALNLSQDSTVTSTNSAFAIQSQPVNKTLAPDASTTFNIRFTPNAEADATASIKIHNYYNEEIFTFIVSGTGYVKRPQVTLKQAATVINHNGEYNFGTVTTGENKDIVFTIGNTGDANLAADGGNWINISGANAGLFTITQQPNSSTTVLPNATTTFTIRYSPVAEGTNFNATVNINTNSRENNNFSFTVKGDGYERKPQVSILYGETAISQNGTIDAGRVLVTLAKTITVTIKNEGDAALTINQADITINGADEAAFTRITSPAVSVPVGSQTTSFNIQCSPIKLGENSATLTIPTNDPNRPNAIVTLKVTGEQGYAIPDVKQGSTTIQNSTVTTQVDFGQVNVGNNSSLTFTIKNIGNITLQLTGTPVIESSNSVFTIPTQPSSATILPNNEVSFNIRYTPTTEGEDTAVITFTDNSPDLEFSFMVKGTGYIQKPQITVQQGITTINPFEEIDFGTVMTGKTNDITFTIGNSGDADLTITAVNSNRINLVDNNSGYFSVTQPTTATVTTTGTTTFTIRFNPTTIGSNYTATVQIKTNSRNNSDFSFQVKGNGRGYIIGETGPGGGLIFYANGNQFKECSDVIGAGTWNTAITYIANTYRGGGYNDWYLPEMWELKFIYQNLYLNDLGDFYNDDEFWSSTTIGETGAMILDFADGVDYPDYKTTTGILIIAIRSFSLQ